MSYVGDSIIGERCSLGAVTILSNFRFDERNISVKIEGESIDSGLDKLGAIIGNDSKTGVNVSVMPGVKIGPNSVVGSHVCLTEDLEPDMIILAEGVHNTVKNKLQVDDENRHKSEERARKLRCVE
jgi:bifunctional UDP-N-acetylglucosamine pyrophosphorylase/glucosamine-1-phosphate N-acetyltransferase